MVNPLETLSIAKEIALDVIEGRRPLPEDLQHMADAPTPVLSAAIQLFITTELAQMADESPQEHSLQYDEHLSIE